MKQSVILKSFPNGLTIILDPDEAFDTLLIEVGRKFAEASKFFKNSKVVLSFDGRMLTEDEEKDLLDVITQNSEIEVLCIIGKEEGKQKQFLKVINQLEVQKAYLSNQMQLHIGNVENGESLETPSTVVILGDVECGGTVYSHRDIIVIGALKGEAYAGLDGEDKHYVVAFDMSPEKLRIGGFKYKAKDKGKWSFRSKKTSMIAYLDDGRVMMEPVTKELIDTVFS